MDKKRIMLYSWVLRGSQRRKIFKHLDKPKTPTLIKEETGIKVSNVSDVLRAMEKLGLVECITPKEKLGRLYKLTKKGETLRLELNT